MKFIIITGGTGGHIFPALRIKEEMEKENFKVIFVLGGNLRIPFEEKLIYISAAPFMGKDIKAVLKNVFINIKGIYESINLLSKNPFPIIATGSYASFPLLFYAFIRNIPYFILEQNSIPGRVNKIFSKKARINFLGFEEAKNYLKGKKIFVGNPLRKFKEIERNEARKILNLKEDEKVILIFGGSQGSRFLNNLGIEISKIMEDYKFILVSGKNFYEEIKEKKRENIILFPFYKEMEILYTACDVAITRAGGITIYELLYFGIPSLLIPFPYATDNHQFYNALCISKKYDFFEMIEEKEANTEKVIEKVKKLFFKKGEKIRFSAEKKIIEEIKKCFLN
ncbi:MAG: UDP-N-acetylglucosamine--N-acetylmuramyl-(pentapeptide) pyrophosphoryl-undecaprenol N-acetylglucosamine transferase [candidate division WOR-3 bacterium]